MANLSTKLSTLLFVILVFSFAIPESIAAGVGGERWTYQHFQPSHGAKWGFIDKTGRFVTEPTYEVVDYLDLGLTFSEGLSAVLCKVKNGLAYGFVDYSGKLVIPAQYVHAGVFSEGVAPVSTGALGFEPEKWKLSVASRADLMPKLFAQYQVVGMTRNKLHHLLGVPHGVAAATKDNDSEGYSMSTAGCGNAQWGLQFQFRNNKVVRYRLTNIDRCGKWRSDNKVPYLGN